MSNSIRIARRKNYPNSYNIWTSHDFFKHNKEVIFEFDEWGVSFRAASISDETGHRTIYPNSKQGYSLGVFDVDIKEGVFYIDEEESNEDKIYFNYD
jgi:hypothetical protein